MTNALKSLFARIERGLTVEIRFVLPPEAEITSVASEDPGTLGMRETFAQLSDISENLVFPKSLSGIIV